MCGAMSILPCRRLVVPPHQREAAYAIVFALHVERELHLLLVLVEPMREHRQQHFDRERFRRVGVIALVALLLPRGSGFEFGLLLGRGPVGPPDVLRFGAVLLFLLLPAHEPIRHDDHGAHRGHAPLADLALGVT